MEYIRAARAMGGKLERRRDEHHDPHREHPWNHGGGGRRDYGRYAQVHLRASGEVLRVLADDSGGGSAGDDDDLPLDERERYDRRNHADLPVPVQDHANRHGSRGRGERVAQRLRMVVE